MRKQLMQSYPRQCPYSCQLCKAVTTFFKHSRQYTKRLWHISSYINYGNKMEVKKKTTHQYKLS